MKKKDIPNPGSDEALALNCLCAVMDNGHGRGYMGQPNVFVINTDCKLHNPTKAKGKKK